MRASFGKQKTDAALLNRMAIGDQKAFRSLVQRYLPYVLKTAERIVGDGNLAEDIAQETMIRLWKKSQEWDGDGTATLKTWLYKVTVNLCIDRQRVKPLMSLENLDWLPTTGPDAPKQVHQHQMNKIIVSLFNDLTEAQRFVIVLSYYEGLSSPEIAEIMDIKTGAVSGLLHRARQTLKIKLADLGIEGWADDKNR